MSDWREYRSREAREFIEKCKKFREDRLLRLDDFEVFEMDESTSSNPVFAVHIQPYRLSKETYDETAALLEESKATGRAVGLGFPLGFSVDTSTGNTIWRQREMFFVLDGTSMGYKAICEDTNTGEMREDKNAWRNISLPVPIRLGDREPRTVKLGELYAFLVAMFYMPSNGRDNVC